MPLYPFLHLPSPTQFSNLSEVASYLRRQWDALQSMRKGKLECVTTLTLAANAATTTITDIRLSPQSVVVFDPKTVNAATELAAGTLYVLTANRGDGSWTVTHANNAQTDRDFQVAIIG